VAVGKDPRVEVAGWMSCFLLEEVAEGCWRVAAEAVGLVEKVGEEEAAVGWINYGGEVVERAGG